MLNKRVMNWFSIFAFGASSLLADGEISSVEITAKEHAKVPLALVVIGATRDLDDIAERVKKDFEFSGQFHVTLEHVQQANSKHYIEDLFDSGYLLAVFLNEGRKKNIEWRVYDTNLVEMVAGKSYHKKGSSVIGWAHNVADMLWPILTGQDGFFSSKIAYCKEVHLPTMKHSVRHVFVADYDGTNEQALVTTPTINLAPRFNRDSQNPLVFYSESTQSNIRLVHADMKKKRKMASNFDGINMLPSFSADGTQVVFCASRGKGTCQLYYYQKGLFKALTHNSGNNVSPAITDDGKRIYYCSDVQAEKPQLYCFDIAADKAIQITHDKHPCYCPSYCGKKNMVAYIKMVEGIMQVFTYDEKSQKHAQVTFDKGHKEECSWSPCGNYLLYCQEHKNKSQLVVFNMLTKQPKTLTAVNQNCTYPIWSGIYDLYPQVIS